LDLPEIADRKLFFGLFCHPFASAQDSVWPWAEALSLCEGSAKGKNLHRRPFGYASGWQGKVSFLRFAQDSASVRLAPQNDKKGVIPSLRLRTAFELLILSFWAIAKNLLFFL